MKPKMNQITILDGFTVNPGDLSWEQLEGLGHLKVYDRTSPEQTAWRAADADIVLTNKVVLDRKILESLPRLKYVGVLATGYNVVDIDAAAERGVVVTNIPAYSSDSVAQMTFAHILISAIGTHRFPNSLARFSESSVSGTSGARWLVLPAAVGWMSSRSPARSRPLFPKAYRKRRSTDCSPFLMCSPSTVRSTMKPGISSVRKPSGK